MEEKDKATQTVEQGSKGFSITSMVLGIISIVLFCIWYLSIPCAILAIIFGIVGIKKGGKGMGIAGLILGIVAIIILTVVLGLGINFSTKFYNEKSKVLENARTSLDEAIEEEKRLSNNFRVD